MVKSPFQVVIVQPTSNIDAFIPPWNPLKMMVKFHQRADKNPKVQSPFFTHRWSNPHGGFPIHGVPLVVIHFRWGFSMKKKPSSVFGVPWWPWKTHENHDIDGCPGTLDPGAQNLPWELAISLAESVFAGLGVGLNWFWPWILDDFGRLWSKSMAQSMAKSIGYWFWYRLWWCIDSPT